MAHIMLLYSLMLNYMYHSLLQSALKIILTQYNNTVKQVVPHIMSLYYHYQTFIICLNQIDTPPAAVLAELQKS